MIQATFVMEQHLGHLTYCRNLQRFVDSSTRIEATWVPVTYSDPRSLWGRVTPLPRHIRGTLCGRGQVRQGLARAARDVAFFNTQVPAVLGGQLTHQQPYIIATDLTPIQYDQMSRQYGHRPDHPGPLKAYKHRVNVAVLRGAARLLPWSTWARESLIKDYGVAPHQIEVVPPGVDLKQWMPGQQRTAGPLRILFVGGDLYRKGGEVLLQAFRTLPSGTAELVLVTRSIVAREAGIVSYHNLQPNSPELINLFQTSDVFVLPTEAEAFGIAVAEASAAGLPAIATPVGGLTDIVVDGETGFLIEPGDVYTLTERLRCLADNPELCRRLGWGARQRAETYFDAHRNAGRVVANLLEAVGRGADGCEHE